MHCYYVDGRVCVGVGADISEWFSVSVRLRQGCVASLVVLCVYRSFR